MRQPSGRTCSAVSARPSNRERTRDCQAECTNTAVDSSDSAQVCDCSRPGHQASRCPLILFLNCILRSPLSEVELAPQRTPLLRIETGDLREQVVQQIGQTRDGVDNLVHAVAQFLVLLADLVTDSS